MGSRRGRRGAPGRQPPTLRGLTLLLAATLALATGCQGDAGPEATDDPKLEELRNERLATLRLSGGELVLDLQLPSGGALGKPTRAEISRVFAFRSARRADDGRAEALDVARETGWRLDVSREEGPIFGSKALPNGGATLTIGFYEDDGVHKVSIALEHRACPPERCGDA